MRVSRDRDFGFFRLHVSPITPIDATRSTMLITRLFLLSAALLYSRHASPPTTSMTDATHAEEPPPSPNRRPPMQTIKDTAHGYGYLLFPSTSASPAPLLIYLHGGGESGPTTDPAGILQEGATGTPPLLLTGSAAHVIPNDLTVVAPRSSRGWSGEAVAKFAASIAGDESRLLGFVGCCWI